MKIEQFENGFKKLKEDILKYGDELSVLNTEDIKDHEELSIFVDGKEIKDKTMYLICVNLYNDKE